MPDEDLTTIADPSTAEATGTSSDELGQGSDPADNIDLEDDVDSLEEGEPEDGDEDDVPEPFHKHPAWQKQRQKAADAEARATALETERNQAQAWAKLAQEQAEEYGFDSPEAMQEAFAKVKSAQAEQKAKEAEEAKRREYIAEYGDESIAERLVEADRRTARAEAIIHKAELRDYNRALDDAKAQLGEHYDPDVEKLLKSFNGDSLPGVTKILTKLVGGVQSKTETVAETNAAVAAARRSTTAKPETGRGATPGSTGQSDENLSWGQAIARSLQNHVGGRRK